MATCPTCLHDMTTADGCTVTHLTWQGQAVPTFPYGRDPGWPAKRERCGDCGARPGHHHHLGCDVQGCPRCRRQLISCGCPWDQLDPGEDDAWDEDDDDPWIEEDDAPVIDLATWAARPEGGGETAASPRSPESR